MTTDRAVWVLGAWEVYLATGDKDWLKQSYEVVRHSLSQDEAMIYDHTTGLVYGEASLPYCRKEVYPAWMQPADIAQSECLSNNALFFRANEIASRMAQLCGDGGVAAHFKQVADAIKEGINNYLWIESAGYYGQYLYGRVNKGLADQYYASADINIILANRDKEIVSSKIFESVSSGYPIVCFYFSEEEQSYKLLSKYPLVLFIRQDQLDDAACGRIRQWMYDNCGKRVDFQLVHDAYDDATPDMVVDVTIDALSENSGENGRQ